MSIPGTTGGTRPPAVSRAVVLSYVIAALIVIGGIVSALTVDTSTVTQQAAANGLDAGAASTATSITRVAAVVGAVIGAVLWAVFATLAGRGRNWARIVVTVFAVLSVIGGLTNLRGGGASVVFGLIEVVLAVLVIVFFFRRESSAWYAELKARRLGGYGGGYGSGGEPGYPQQPYQQG